LGLLWSSWMFLRKERDNRYNKESNEY